MRFLSNFYQFNVKKTLPLEQDACSTLEQDGGATLRNIDTIKTHIMNTVDKLRLCPCIKRIVSVPKYISQGIRSGFLTKRKYFEREIQ